MIRRGKGQVPVTRKRRAIKAKGSPVVDPPAAKIALRVTETASGSLNIEAPGALLSPTRPTLTPPRLVTPSPRRRAVRKVNEGYPPLEIIPSNIQREMPPSRSRDKRKLPSRFCEQGVCKAARRGFTLYRKLRIRGLGYRGPGRPADWPSFALQFRGRDRAHLILPRPVGTTRYILADSYLIYEGLSSRGLLQDFEKTDPRTVSKETW